MATSHHILIVDDHSEIRQSIAAYLFREGFQTGAVGGAAEMDRYLARHTVDLIVLDIMLPEEDGLSICSRIVESKKIPILMLSALDTENDIITGLNIGADDYLSKPFNPKELVARIHTILRRNNRPNENAPVYAGKKISFGGVTLDYDARQIHRIDGVNEVLTSAEIALLTILLERARSVVSRDDLLLLTTGRIAGPMDRTVDNQISRLRKKIEPDVLRPRIIATVRNGGYSLSCDVSAVG